MHDYIGKFIFDTFLLSCDVFLLTCIPRKSQFVHLLKKTSLNIYPNNAVEHTIIAITIVVSIIIIIVYIIYICRLSIK